MSPVARFITRFFSSFVTGFFALFFALFVLVMALPAPAFAQADFTLQMSPFNHNGAIDPTGTASASLTLAPLNGFTGSVALTCNITPAPANGNQGCAISPQTVTPPNGASVTITTLITGPPSSEWAPGGYTITVTGTASSGTPQTASQLLTVLSVTPSFTITVGNVVSPPSVPAGSAGVGTIDVNPINGYIGSVTLSCSSVAPLVVSPPVCTFNPPTVSVPGALATGTSSSQLTINTIGPLTPVTQNRGIRGFYAIWLPLPMLALWGAAAGGKRFRAWGVFGLLVMVAMMLLLPACSTTTTPQAVNSSTIITPNNTYTFTVTGVDADGHSASNITTGSTSSVTLGVTTATTD